jgi:hypothetical protein
MSKLNRREFLQRAALLGAAVAGAGTLATACTKKEDAGGDELFCNDTSNMDQSAIQMREAQNYVEESPKPEENCANCQLYVEPEAEGECGKCTLFQNTVVHPKGWCDSWAPKA